MLNSPHKDENPPGWSYNPSSWKQRLPLVGVAVTGFIIAGYLSLYQFHLINDVWDPIFGDGTKKILNSPVSRLLPIPDAALGAIGYIADAISGLIGGTKRWKRIPWIVVMFGFFAGPLGLVSVLLVILQPVAFQAWCSLCLASAVCSVAMIGPAMDEVLASFQYLKRCKNEGFSMWKSFWGSREIFEKPE